jgi:hypothetical protein
LDDLADELANEPPGSSAHNAAMAEFTRRQALAEEAAAAAAKATAEATRYMLWSVIVLAVASVVNLLLTYLPHH